MKTRAKKKKMSQITQNLLKIRTTIFKETANDSVKIIVVTKTRSVMEINKAIDSGALYLGENRVQESEEKFRQIKAPVEKRLIGKLQSNKIKKAVTLFDSIDSVSSYSLAEKISKQCTGSEKKQRVLLQVNTSEEPTKNGFLQRDKKEIIRCFSLKGIKIEGLMTIGAHTKEKERVKKSFRDLKKLFLEINGRLTKEQQMTELSMGMSSDFLLAIKEGATMVRLGTSIFGERKENV